MVLPGMEGMNFYIADPLGRKELNLNDDWRAVWVEGGDFPPGAPVVYGYVMVVMEDKGYVTRRAGDEVWGVVEGVVSPVEKPAQFVKRASLEQAGVQAGRAVPIGYFDCRATSNNTDYPVGSSTIRPVTLMVAKKVKDIGRDSGFERRRLPLNEFAGALRKRYPEVHDAMATALDRYMVMRARGES